MINADPVASIISSSALNIEQQKFLDQWLIYEKRNFLILAAACLIIAAYLFVVNPFSVFANIDDPNAYLLQTLASLLPFIFLFEALVLFWRSTRAEVIRHKLTQIMPWRQKARILLCFGFVAGILWLGVQQLNYSGSLFLLALLVTGVALIFAMICRWRIRQIAKFRALTTPTQ